MRLVYQYRLLMCCKNLSLNLSQGNPDCRGIDRNSDSHSLLTKRVNSTAVSCLMQVIVQQRLVSHLSYIPKERSLHSWTVCINAHCQSFVFCFVFIDRLFGITLLCLEDTTNISDHTVVFLQNLYLVGWFTGKHQCCIAHRFSVFTQLLWDHWQVQPYLHRAGTAPSPSGRSMGALAISFCWWSYCRSLSRRSKA